MKTLYLVTLVQDSKNIVVIVTDSQTKANHLCSIKNSNLAPNTRDYYSWSQILVTDESHRGVVLC